ncbi:hypothetical protein [Streptomyces specialis]|uniref:hypothetical protein n=1 Tax=Streptomyces specialis TaxID=498367 RepID=UPI001F359A25|nr:hypothetical protein [Streptomyces specialis]
MNACQPLTVRARAGVCGAPAAARPAMIHSMNAARTELCSLRISGLLWVRRTTAR